MPFNSIFIYTYKYYFINLHLFFFRKKERKVFTYLSQSWEIHYRLKFQLFDPYYA